MPRSKSRRSSSPQAEAETMPVSIPGLRYVTDAHAGFRRRRCGRGFTYADTAGRTIRDPDARARIKALGIPPAWTEVWICPWPNGHLQATGRDARGRKQYRYHARWRARRDAAKFDRLIAFGRALPHIRARCDLDLARQGVPRDKVLAAVVLLLGSTLIRVGNEEYARLNRSFGLTTFKDGHAAIDGARIRFRFRGKGGRQHEVAISDRRLARVVRRCQELPGQELFQYLDEAGEVRDVESQDVNDYLRAISGEAFSAKDFRTWAGTVLAYRALQMTAADDADRGPRDLTAAMRRAADGLGNTPAVARGSYVHPAIVDAFVEGSLGDAAAGTAARGGDASLRPDRAEERAVLTLLQRHRS